MLITAYQVNNVLRMYRNQLRKSRISSGRNHSETGIHERISHSARDRRKRIIDNITANIVEKITQYGPHNKIEIEVFEKLKSQYGGNLAISGDNPNGLIFKEIDENGETINSLSIEDSNFLTNKLKEITKETIDKNMK